MDSLFSKLDPKAPQNYNNKKYLCSFLHLGNHTCYGIITVTYNVNVLQQPSKKCILMKWHRCLNHTFSDNVTSPKLAEKIHLINCLQHILHNSN